MRFLRWVPLVLILGALGCRSVQPVDVLGTWVITDASRSALPAALQKASATIVFDSDGNFRASEMPAMFDVPGRQPERLESGRGTWKVPPGDSRQRIQLECREIAEWTWSELPFGKELSVSSGWSSVELYYYVGAPDNGRRVVFEKR